MKKCFAIFTILLILTLSACSKSNKLFELVGEHHYYSSSSLQFVTEKSEYTSRDTIIRYSITNISDKEHAIGDDSDCFELHRFTDGEWQKVGTKIDRYWTMAALILEPGKTVQRQIDLEEYFHLPLEEGEYRISVDYLLSNTFTVS